MIADFFIRRPIFTIVIFIIVILAGLGFMVTLPVAQFPQIAPPNVAISAMFPGADAPGSERTMTIPIENQINGIDQMLYMTSTASSDGVSITNVAFEVGTNIDMALVNTFNAVSLAQARLPLEAQQLGITVQKKSPTILQVLTFQSPDARYDLTYISNYVSNNIVKELKRLPGVEDAQVIGAKDYAMRVWLNPDLLAKHQVTTTDVYKAIQEQNAQNPTGRIGMPPTASPLAMTYAILTEGRLKDAEGFENIILKANPVDGSSLRLKDVARVELGSVAYNFLGRINGQPCITVGIFSKPGYNDLTVANSVRQTMAELSKRLPEGITTSLPHDTTIFVSISIKEVVKTLFEAVFLVFFIVYIFLQNWRATVIPIIAVPVSLIGTFIGMGALGYSINTLTLFGMVLAIGMVVDDAIVVVENVERLMDEEKLSPLDATLKAMREVSGPIVAIVCVLCSVFIPVAFIGGLVGEIYKQFAITIAISVTISGFTALTLSPALCALLLKPHSKPPLKPLQIFNQGFDRLREQYGRFVNLFNRRTFLSVCIFGGVLLLSGGLIQRLPTSLVPNEDQGYLVASVIMPDGSSLERTSDVVKKIEEIARTIPAIQDAIALTGFDFINAQLKQNSAAVFLRMKDWSLRKDPHLQAPAVLAQFLAQASQIKEGIVLAFNPPAIPGLGKIGGIEFYLEDHGGRTLEERSQLTQAFIHEATKRPELRQVMTTLNTNSPQYLFNVDKPKVKAMGVSLSEVYNAINSFYGTRYVNDFNLFGNVYQVQLQGETALRGDIHLLDRIYVRSGTTNRMIPLSALSRLEKTVGPEMVDRFNTYSASFLSAQPNTGYSSGQAIQALEEIGKAHLPKDMVLSWTGAVFQQKKASGHASIIFLLGLLMIVLVLAAQYEKVLLPFAVLLSVPFGILGAALAVTICGMTNDIYFQIGLLTLIGLSAKNAILIVEFAMLAREEGRPILDAALEAAKLRFRPILMTSLAFILGVVPLAISSGAGAASRHSIGIGILGGMLGATCLAVFFIPFFYVQVQTFSEFLSKLRERIGL